MVDKTNRYKARRSFIKEETQKYNDSAQKIVHDLNNWIQTGFHYEPRFRTEASRAVESLIKLGCTNDKRYDSLVKLRDRNINLHREDAEVIMHQLAYVKQLSDDKKYSVFVIKPPALFII